MRRMGGCITIISRMCVCLCLCMCMCLAGCGDRTGTTTLHVAMPYSDNVLEPSDNYYVEWLEDKTGIGIEPVIIRQRVSTEYLDDLFASGSDIDIVMFGEDFEISEPELKTYADKGYLAVRPDGTLFYPNYGRKPVGDCGQILWINADWLGRLKLMVPTTTDELKEVLTAFKDMDPNGNGLQDEIPLLSCEADYAYSTQELLLESYIYNDPYNDRKYTDADGRLIDASLTEEFTDGLRFCEELESDGLLHTVAGEDSFLAFTELINSPADMVGAFTSDSVSKVFYQGNPEIMAKYMHVAPLKGPKGVSNALFVARTPQVGAIICAGSKHKDEAVRLLDMMMTPEGSLIARYGQQGVDWDYSDGTDVSIYGTSSTISTRNYIWNTPQNKHLNGIGPMDVPIEYLKGVTWNGINSDSEYIDARAQMSYAAYLPGNRVIPSEARNLTMQDTNIKKESD